MIPPSVPFNDESLEKISRGVWRIRTHPNNGPGKDISPPVYPKMLSEDNSTSIILPLYRDALRFAIPQVKCEFRSSMSVRSCRIEYNDEI
ncbi:hypothetical protein ABKN59_001296 [Abortiporus biennis]